MPLLSVRLSIPPSVCMPIRPSVYSFVRLPVHLSILPSIRPFIGPSLHMYGPLVCLSSRLTHPVFCPVICLSFQPTFRLSSRSSGRLPLQTTACLSCLSPIHLFVFNDYNPMDVIYTKFKFRIFKGYS